MNSTSANVRQGGNTCLEHLPTPADPVAELGRHRPRLVASSAISCILVAVSSIPAIGEIRCAALDAMRATRSRHAASMKEGLDWRSVAKALEESRGICLTPD